MTLKAETRYAIETVAAKTPGTKMVAMGELG